VSVGRELKYLNSDYEQKHRGRPTMLQTVPTYSTARQSMIQSQAGFGTIDVYRSKSSEIVRIGRSLKEPTAIDRGRWSCSDVEALERIITEMGAEAAQHAR
jgi:hypothetical protein